MPVSRVVACRLRPAFTIVEMVVVMAIVGIIALVVVPAILNNTPTTATATSPVETILRASQQAAADSGRTVRLTVDPSSGAYLATMEGLDQPLATGTLALDGASIASDSVRAQFTFNPNGTSYGDSIQVRGGRGYAVVVVDPWTGAPHVHTW